MGLGVLDGLHNGDMPGLTDLFPVALQPPDSYFEPIPDLPRGTDITVGSARGADHVYGRFVLWDTCVESAGHTSCYLAPRSPSGYQSFHQGYVTTASGNEVPIGMIGSKGHAPPGATVEEAALHYQYPEWSKARVRIIEDEDGAYVTGQLMPGVTFAEVEMVKSAALSGHWQYRERMPLVTGGFGEGIDCLGPTLVSRPGAPLPGRDEFELVASASTDNIQVFYSMPVRGSAMPETTTADPVVAPIMFDRDGLRYTQTSEGVFETGPIPVSCTSCTGGVTAAAESLDAAASQTQVDALEARVDAIETEFTRREAERMTADDVALESV